MKEGPVAVVLFRVTELLSTGRTQGEKQRKGKLMCAEATGGSCLNAQLFFDFVPIEPEGGKNTSSKYAADVALKTPTVGQHHLRNLGVAPIAHCDAALAQLSAVARSLWAARGSCGS